LKKAAIIGSVLLLGACSTLRLAYNSAPQLAGWWVDSYLDLNSEQSPRAREALQQWFSWHRQTQLVDYANWLSALEKRVPDATSADAVCALFDQARARLTPAFDQAYGYAADLTPYLTPAQLKSLEERYAKNNKEFRKDYLQPDAAERRKQSVKRSVERFEEFYGSLNDAQRRIIEAAAAASPFEPQMSLLNDKPERGLALTQMRQLSDAAQNPGDVEVRVYQQRLQTHSCKLTAEVHNSSTAAQRAQARQKLRGWEADLRALAGERVAQQTQP
jgi:hypothetical protein